MTGFQFIDGDKVGVKAWTKGVQFEEQALAQVKNITTLPFIHKHVAIMPDVHWGMGATVGSVIPMVKAIVPAAVGVDIGCGMMAALTTLRLEDVFGKLPAIRSAIEKAVPHGRTGDGKVSVDRGAWRNVPKSHADMWASIEPELTTIVEAYPELKRASESAPHHLGTLGTGNHFIELCTDELNRIWIMLHSGSRGIGNRIGSVFIEKAKEDMRNWFINLPDVDLAYLPEGSKHFSWYIKAVNWAQEFALHNRHFMMAATVQAMRTILSTEWNAKKMAINCHHNYVSKEYHFGEEVWLTRKGAVCAREGLLGIIPGSMGAKSFIVRGKGNPDSFNSCSHGAGRAMSRGAAKKMFSLDDHAKATEGVECRKDDGVIDETPGAYKSIDAVMAAQSDLVDVVHTLKQIICVKG